MRELGSNQHIKQARMVASTSANLARPVVNRPTMPVRLAANAPASAAALPPPGAGLSAARCSANCTTLSSTNCVVVAGSLISSIPSRLPNFDCCILTIHLRHLNVHEDNIRFANLKLFYCFLSIFSLYYNCFWYQFCNYCFY